jgi:hypothetical protein
MIVYLDKEDIVYDFILKVASGQSNLEECKAWFLENSVNV